MYTKKGLRAHQSEVHANAGVSPHVSAQQLAVGIEPLQA